MLSDINHVILAYRIHKFLMHVLFASACSHRDWGIALHILSIVCCGVMGYGMGEEGKLIAHGKVMSVQRGTVHRVPIYEGYVSVEVKKAKMTSMYFLEV